MKQWQEDLLQMVAHENDGAAAFKRIVAAAADLGFERCAYGLRLPYPVSAPRTVLMNDYPGAWQRRYEEAGYLGVDPVVRHGACTQRPLLWSNELFAETPQLWDEARAHGLCHGWSQSSLGLAGSSMLSLVRSRDPVTPAEIQAHGLHLQWLAQVAHVTLSRLIAGEATRRVEAVLTPRETQILRLSADGLTSSDIAQRLALSEHTVNFHIRNVIVKLDAPNRTAAVVQAALMGLLH